MNDKREALHKIGLVRCNSGHESEAVTWDCPVCVNRMRAERDKLLEACTLTLEWCGVRDVDDIPEGPLFTEEFIEVAKRLVAAKSFAWGGAQ